MKIYSSKIDDVVKKRDEYESRIKGLKDKRDRAWQKYSAADREICSGIEAEVAELLSRVPLTFQITADQALVDPDRMSGYTVRVNYRGSSNSDLQWEFSVRLSRSGVITKNDGRWYSLDAASAEDLEYSVKALRILQGANWESILDKAQPQYSDYTNKEDEAELARLQNERPDFESEEFDAILEQALEEGKWISLKSIPDTDYIRGRSRATAFFQPTRIGAKFVDGTLMDMTYGGRPHSLQLKISKAKLRPCVTKPYSVVSISEEE